MFEIFQLPECKSSRVDVMKVDGMVSNIEYWRIATKHDFLENEKVPLLKYYMLEK